MHVDARAHAGSCSMADEYARGLPTGTDARFSSSANDSNICTHIVILTHLSLTVKLDQQILELALLYKTLVPPLFQTIFILTFLNYGIFYTYRYKLCLKL